MTLGFSALVFVVFFLVQIAVLIPNMVIAELGGANIASPEFRNSLGSSGLNGPIDWFIVQATARNRMIRNGLFLANRHLQPRYNHTTRYLPIWRKGPLHKFCGSIML